MNTDYQELKRKILFEHLEKYKDTSHREIARILCRDYHEFFPEYEEARTHIRIYRGKCGSEMRESIKMRKYYKA